MDTEILGVQTALQHRPARRPGGLQKVQSLPNALNQTFDSELGYLVRAAGNSRVTIKDGHFTAGLTAVQAGDNAVVEIYGGYFEALAGYSGKNWILNLVDNTNAKIIVYGGTFVNFDPSDTNTEPAGVSDNFVAEGYKVVMTTDEATGNKIYTVVPEE